MQNENQEQRFKGYLELAKMSYQQAVNTLKKKYGGATEDYCQTKVNSVLVGTLNTGLIFTLMKLNHDRLIKEFKEVMA